MNRDFELERRLTPSGSKTFVVGWHKTATTSLSHALRLLGIPCWHFPYQLCPFIFDRIPDFRLLASWRAAADMPVPLIYKDLDREFPHSKFIFTVRDRLEWLCSVKRMFEIGNKPRMEFGGRSFWDVESETKYTHLIHEKAYGAREFDESRFLKRFERHANDVRSYFCHWPDRLLELDVSSRLTWKPLCHFLGRPEPSLPFPLLNVANSGPWVVNGITIDPL